MDAKKSKEYYDLTRMATVTNDEMFTILKRGNVQKVRILRELHQRRVSEEESKQWLSAKEGLAITTRLSAVILNLKKDGFEIQARQGHESRHFEYRLKDLLTLNGEVPPATVMREQSILEPSNQE